MTYEEAIEILYDSRLMSYVNEALDKAKEALKKQVSEKPTLVDECSWHCPSCGAEFEFSDGYYDEFHYCPNCGQAIQWEDEDKE